MILQVFDVSTSPSDGGQEILLIHSCIYDVSMEISELTHCLEFEHLFGIMLRVRLICCLE